MAAKVAYVQLMPIVEAIRLLSSKSDGENFSLDRKPEMHATLDVAPFAAKAKELNRELQDLIDAGCQTLVAQYCCDGGHVRAQATLNEDDGPLVRVPLNVGSEYREQFHALKIARQYFDSSDMTTGFATIPVNARGNEYIYIVARASGEEAAALFVLDRRTGDAREDITLVTRMDLPVGDVGLTFASPSSWRGKRTTISISVLA